VSEALLGMGWRVAPRVAESKIRQSEYFIVTTIIIIIIIIMFMKS